jgi:hypothetical protein
MIFDSSTLILLAKIDLLKERAEDISIVMPPKVKEECLSKDSLDALLIRTLIAEGKIKVRRRGIGKPLEGSRQVLESRRGRRRRSGWEKGLGVP